MNAHKILDAPMPIDCRAMPIDCRAMPVDCRAMPIDFRDENLNAPINNELTMLLNELRYFAETDWVTLEKENPEEYERRYEAYIDLAFKWKIRACI